MRISKEVEIMNASFYEYITDQATDILINLQEVTTACQLVDYFLHQKLNLVGLIKNAESEYEWLKDELPLKSGNQSGAIASPIVVDSLERKILLSQGVDIYLTSLSVKHFCNKTEFESSCLTFKKLGIIDVKVKPNSRGARKSFCFTKFRLTNEYSSDQKLEFSNNLLFFSISVDEYKASFTASMNSSLESSFLDHSNDSTI